ncbi:hypothetical protein T492DRAFT_1145530 [Pavlovales sp. CCMP2436]|nr:hypothetical protein T492DRAFT_1145530 [Pavlovales sp. CCMP2436]
MAELRGEVAAFMKGLGMGGAAACALASTDGELDPFKQRNELDEEEHAAKPRAPAGYSREERQALRKAERSAVQEERDGADPKPATKTRPVARLGLLSLRWMAFNASLCRTRCSPIATVVTLATPTTALSHPSMP